MSDKPTTDVNLWLQVNSTVAGDNDITTHMALMIFSPSTYTDFVVTLTAAEDADMTNGTSTITHTVTGGGYNNATATLTAVEDDNDVLTVVEVTATTVLLKLTGYSGDWWYQKSGATEYGKAPDNDSDGTSDSSFRLTGLTENTSLRVTAYSASTCGSANQVAQSNQFQTRKQVFSQSKITHNSVRLTLFGWDTDEDGNWYYGKTNTWCSGPVSQSYSDKTGLTQNTQYQYAAYSDSGCNSQLGQAVTFKTQMAPVSVSNLNTSGGVASTNFGIYGNGVNYRMGASFRTGSAANGYLLKSVTAKIGENTSQPITAKLYSNSSGSTPQNQMADLGTITTTGSGHVIEITFTCDSQVSNNNCDLSKDTIYQITLEVTPSNCTAYCTQGWNATSSNVETNDPSGAGWTIGYDLIVKQGNGNWYHYKNNETTRMKVNALIK